MNPSSVTPIKTVTTLKLPNGHTLYFSGLIEDIEPLKEFLSPVSEVVTVREAASMYHVTPSTIRYHLDRGRLVWRKATDAANGVILIELASLEKLYGQPPNPCTLMATV